MDTRLNLMIFVHRNFNNKCNSCRSLQSNNNVLFVIFLGTNPGKNFTQIKNALTVGVLHKIP